MSAARQTTDQGDQGIQVLFAMTGRARPIELQDGLFSGTIAAIRVTHGMLS